MQSKIILCIGIISVASIIVSLILLVKSTQTVKPIQFISNKDILGDSNQATSSANPSASSGQVTKNVIHVDIEGGVRAPGLYEFSSASRIDDAIARAGGLSDDADVEVIAKQINRASKLIDGQKIYIPKKNQTSHNYDSLLRPEDKSQNVSLININLASQSELETLSGVGPVTAKKIIDNRPYQVLEDLVSKKAVGNALFEKIKENISL